MTIFCYFELSILFCCEFFAFALSFQFHFVASSLFCFDFFSFAVLIAGYYRNLHIPPSKTFPPGSYHYYERAETVTIIKLVKILVTSFDKSHHLCTLYIVGHCFDVPSFRFKHIEVLRLFNLTNKIFTKKYIVQEQLPFPTNFLIISTTICQTKIFFVTFFPILISFIPLPY